MQEIVEKHKCTACNACKSICPKSAISMVENDEGFLYPKIDDKKCIDCGLCKKTCPVINSNSNESLNLGYVAYAKDTYVRKSSSSGGIFSIIATYVLNNNGIVIGAAFDKNNKLNHIAIVDKEELSKLKGSKYLQSNLNNIFDFVKNNLKTKKILFVGTPCQVSGLRYFLKKDYDNLICIDLFCHGVPSPKLFEKYISGLEKKYKDKLISFNFRDKSTGWTSYSYTAKFQNKSFTELHNSNIYNGLFLSNFALRDSCYNCNFKIGNKYSDITLGDFWGVKFKYPDMYKDDGVSAVIINTQKGIKLFNKIKNNIVYKSCLIDDIVSNNELLKKSCIRPNNRNVFFEDLDILCIDKLAKKYIPKKKIIAKIKNKIGWIVKKRLKKSR